MEKQAAAIDNLLPEMISVFRSAPSVLLMLSIISITVHPHCNVSKLDKSLLKIYTIIITHFFDTFQGIYIYYIAFVRGDGENGCITRTCNPAVMGFELIGLCAFTVFYTTQSQQTKKPNGKENLVIRLFFVISHMTCK